MRQVATLLYAVLTFMLTACGGRVITVTIDDACARRHFVAALNSEHVRYEISTGGKITYRGPDLDKFNDVYEAYLKWHKTTPVAELCNETRG